MTYKDKVIKRLFEKREVIEETGCWIWNGTLDRGGYGQFYYNGKVTRVHRVSAELFLNADLSLGRSQCVLHKCDIRNCFNPDHLFLGTYKDNNKDCVKKGRHIPGTKVNVKKGVEAGNSKLTESEVREIRKRIAAGESTRKVAKDFGISSPAVSKIARRETWAHID